MSMTIDDKALRKRLKGMENRARDARPAFREFAQYMRVQTDNTFQRLRLGGSYRGVLWDYFKPQYTRKTDGVVVPAWGGVPKFWGEGDVLGRKRPSGALVKQGDAIMQDTMTMRGKAALVVALRKNEVTLGPQGVKYAAAQQARRPFLFFEIPKDSNRFVSILRRYLMGTGK
jgi:hypothetical protein